jgi:DNA-binding GntR family transcriptional regulator
MPIVFSLNPSDGLPLYIQLINVIKTAIAKGELQPGDGIPSERELGETLAIARGTVRKAFQQLFDEGILIRQQGAGTFVALTCASHSPCWKALARWSMPAEVRHKASWLAISVGLLHRWSVRSCK